MPLSSLRRVVPLVALVVARPLTAQWTATFGFPNGTPTPLALVTSRPVVQVTALDGPADAFRVVANPLTIAPLQSGALRSSGGSGAALEFRFPGLWGAAELTVGVVPDATGGRDALTLRAFLRGAEVGQATVAGVVRPGGTLAEAVLAYRGATFDRLVLDAGGRDFAVASIYFVGPGLPASVPEPHTVVLTAAGAGALVLVGRRRRHPRA